MKINISIIICLFHLALSYEYALSSEIIVDKNSDIKTVTEALQLAENGDVIKVGKGVYTERITVDKSVKLIGINRPELNGNGDGTVVKIEASDVVLEGFLVKATGSSLSMEDCAIEAENSPGILVHNNILEDVLFGIYIKNSPDSIISNNVIRGKNLSLPDRGDGIRLWYSSNTQILNNKLFNTRDLVIWWSSNTLIKRNEVRNGRYGLHYMYSNHNHFEHNLFEGNAVGGFLMYSNDIKFIENIFAKNQGLASGYGVGFKDLDNIIADRNIFIDNRIGIYADNSPHSVNSWNEINNNVVAFNDIGVSLMPSIERNLVTKNSFIENYEQVEIRGGGKLKGNKWYKNERGNYWSNYSGYDINKDGTGDIPFIYESLFENIIDKNPKLRLFIYSPATQAIELASQAVPVIKPIPKLTDKYPLSLPNVPDISATGQSKKSSLFLYISLMMILLPVIIYTYIKSGGWIK